MRPVMRTGVVVALTFVLAVWRADAQPSGQAPTVSGDFDGDGKADMGLYTKSTGTWKFLYSSTNFTTSGSLTFGGSLDVPVPGDDDGDGRTDAAVSDALCRSRCILHPASISSAAIAAAVRLMDGRSPAWKTARRPR